LVIKKLEVKTLGSLAHDTRTGGCAKSRFRACAQRSQIHIIPTLNISHRFFKEPRDLYYDG